VPVVSDSENSAWTAIDALRGEIDEIDRRLLEMLNERARRVVEIGRIKHASGLALYQPDRERKVFETVEAANPGPLSGRAIRRLFERILDESRSVERHVMEPSAGGPLPAPDSTKGGER
jgi:chorismate mutase